MFSVIVYCCCCVLLPCIVVAVSVVCLLSVYGMKLVYTGVERVNMTIGEIGGRVL